MLKLLSPANSCVTFILISLILSTTISSSAPLPNDLPDVIDESAGNVASLEKKYDGSSSEVVSEATSLAPNSPVEFVTEQPASNNIASNSEENKQQQTTDNNNQEPSAIETLTSPRVEESGPISDKTTPITEVPSSSSSSSTETKLPPTTLDSDPISSQSQSESAVPTTTNKQDGPTTLSVTQELPTSKKANDESSSDAMYGSSSTEAKIESMSPTTIIPKIEVSKEDTTSSTTTTAPSVDDNNSEKPKEQTLKPVDVMVPEVPSNVESKTKPGEVSSDIQPVVKDLSETKQVATKTDSINDDKKSIVITDLLANKDDTENDLNSPDLDGPVDFSSNPKDSGLNNHGHDGRFHYAFDGAPLDTNQNKIETTTARSSPSEVSEKSETEKQTSTTAPPPPPSSPPPATSLAPVQTDMDSKKQQESTSVTAITTNDETTTKSSTDNAKPLLGSELPGNTVRSGESDKKKVEETEKEVTKSKEEEKPVVESTTVAGVGKKDEDISDNSSELEGKLAPKSKPTVDTINKDSKPEPAVVTKQSESAGSSSFAPTSSSSTTSTTTTTTTTALSPSSSDDKIKILTAAIVPVIVSSIANGNKKIDSLAPSSKPIVPDTIAKESDNRSSSKPDQLEQTVNNNATSTTLGSSTKRPTTSSSSWPSWSQGTTGVGRRRPQVPSLLPLPPFRRRKPPTRPTFGDDSIDSTYSTTSTTTKTRASSGPSSTRKPYRPHSTSFNTPHASGFSPLDDDTTYSGLGGGHSGSRRHYHHRYHHHHHHHDKPARRNRPSYGTDNLRPSFYDNHHDSGYNVNEDRPTHAVGTREGAVSESNQGSSLGNTNVGGGFSSTERRRPGIGGLFGGGGGIGDMLNPFTSFLDRNPLGSVLSGGRGESHTHGGYDGDYGHRHRHGHHRPHNHRENHGHHGHHGGHGGGHGHNGGYDHGGYGGGHDSVYGGGYGGGHGGHGIGNEGYGGEYGDVYQPRPPPIVGGRPYGGDSYGDQFRPIGGEWSPFDSLFSTFDDMFSGGGSNRPFGYRKNITSTVINSTNNGPTSSSGGSSVNKDTIITTNDDDTTETSTTDIPRIPTMRRLTSSQRSRDSGSNQPVVVAKRQTSESSPIDKLKHLAPSSYLERSSSMEKDSQKESAVSISDIASKPTKSDEPSEPVIGNNETYKIPLESPSQNGPCNGPDVDLKRGLVCFFMHINKPVHQFNWFPLNLNKMFSIPNVPIQKSVLSV